MAITTSVSDWTAANVSKTLSIQSALNSKLRLYKIKCTAGGSDTYATNGVSADIKQARVSTLVSVIAETSSLNVLVRYDKDAQKIKLFEALNTTAGGFEEVANGTSIANATFEFLVLGY
ncbi:MAG: hypothetical protein ACKO7N_03935 [Candidatus Nitrosotenuis sp.]